MPRALTIEEKVERVEAKRLEERQPRKTRASFNATEGKLRIGHTITGYHLHIINDTPGRLDLAISTGYEFVSPDEVGGVTTNVVSRNTDINSDKVRYMVGTSDGGEPLYGYLMKIRNEFYEEDQEKLQAKNDLIDSAVRGGKITGDGQSTEGFYIPKGGIKMTKG